MQTPAPRASRGLAFTVPGLGLCLIIGWGSTFYLPSVLGPAIATDLGIAPSLVFGGVTLMFLVGAVVSPYAGRLVDRHGARGVMASGSLLCAAALALLAVARGPVAFVIAWIGIGLAYPLMLNQAAFTGLAQRDGERARRSITLLTFITGLASTAAWPASAFLQGQLGWRGTVALYAATHLVVCLPVHLLVLPRWSGQTRADLKGAAEAAPTLPRGQVALLGFVLSAAGFVSVGLSLNLIALFAASGMGQAGATALAALSGPAQVASRILDMAMGTRHSALVTALVAALLHPACFVALATGGGGGLLAFTVLFGAANGLMTVARARLPLELAGPRRYGALAGVLALPNNITAAIGPPVFAATLEAGGGAAVLALGAGVALMVVAGLSLLFAWRRR